MNYVILKIFKGKLFRLISSTRCWFIFYWISIWHISVKYFQEKYTIMHFFSLVIFCFYSFIWEKKKIIYSVELQFEIFINIFYQSGKFIMQKPRFNVTQKIYLKKKNKYCFAFINIVSRKNTHKNPSIYMKINIFWIPRLKIKKKNLYRFTNGVN